ncbi:MAG: sulfotransferase [Acidimicrobiales bacterium]|nr:sulfotransferase [Acidimicrobiales bacterium]
MPRSTTPNSRFYVPADIEPDATRRRGTDLERRALALASRLGWRHGTRQRLLGAATAKRHRHALAGLRTVVLFVGHGRSGSTLAGTLLDAHRNALVAHEADVLQWFGRGFGRDALLGHLVRREQWFVHDQRATWWGYDYRVPGQHQGELGELHVIGDKQTGLTTDALGADPTLLERFRTAVGLEVRVLNVVRDPVATLATIDRRQADRGVTVRPIGELAAEYFRRCDVIAQLRSRPDVAQFDLHHAELVADPRATLAELCDFLGLPLDAAWLDACAAVVAPPSAPRPAPGHWPAGTVDDIRATAARYGHLARYAS